MDDQPSEAKQKRTSISDEQTRILEGYKTKGLTGTAKKHQVLLHQAIAETGLPDEVVRRWIYNSQRVPEVNTLPKNKGSHGRALSAYNILSQTMGSRGQDKFKRHKLWSAAYNRLPPQEKQLYIKEAKRRNSIPLRELSDEEQQSVVKSSLKKIRKEFQILQQIPGCHGLCIVTEGTGFHNSSCGSGTNVLDDVELSIQMKFNESIETVIPKKKSAKEQYLLLQQEAQTKMKMMYGQYLGEEGQRKFPYAKHKAGKTSFHVVGLPQGFKLKKPTDMTTAQLHVLLSSNLSIKKKLAEPSVTTPIHDPSMAEPSAAVTSNSQASLSIPMEASAYIAPPRGALFREVTQQPQPLISMEATSHVAPTSGAPYIVSSEQVPFSTPTETTSCVVSVNAAPSLTPLVRVPFSTHMESTQYVAPMRTAPYVGHPMQPLQPTAMEMTSHVPSLNAAPSVAPPVQVPFSMSMETASHVAPLKAAPSVAPPMQNSLSTPMEATSHMAPMWAAPSSSLPVQVPYSVSMETTSNVAPSKAAPSVAPPVQVPFTMSMETASHVAPLKAAPSVAPPVQVPFSMSMETASHVARLKHAPSVAPSVQVPFSMSMETASHVAPLKAAPSVAPPVQPPLGTPMEAMSFVASTFLAPIEVVSHVGSHMQDVSCASILDNPTSTPAALAEPTTPIPVQGTPTAKTSSLINPIPSCEEIKANVKVVPNTLNEEALPGVQLMGKTIEENRLKNPSTVHSHSTLKALVGRSVKHLWVLGGGPFTDWFEGIIVKKNKIQFGIDFQDGRDIETLTNRCFQHQLKAGTLYVVD